MSSAKAQQEKILKLNIKDKKLCRLFHCKELTDKDALFLGYVYEERQNLHFRYAVFLSGALALLLRTFLFK